jgi:hypothetical protein
MAEANRFPSAGGAIFFMSGVFARDFTDVESFGSAAGDAQNSIQSPSVPMRVLLDSSFHSE